MVLGESSINYHRDACEIANIVNPDGYVEDFSRFEFFTSKMHEALKAKPAENPVIISEPSIHNKDNRTKIAEILFEKIGSACIFIAKSAVLTAYSQGKSTALVLDSGAAHTYAVPIHEGFVLSKSTFKESFGGNTISKLIVDNLASKSVEIKPACLFEKQADPSGGYKAVDIPSEKVTESYREYQAHNVIKQIKQQVLRVSEMPIAKMGDEMLEYHKQPYELPDGT